MIDISIIVVISLLLVAIIWGVIACAHLEKEGVVIFIEILSLCALTFVLFAIA